ncbi:MAG: hypothetical protein V7K98_11850 [Nostoc sp.]|uniref:hypothetical protein n=1 Tax=Nostoc sp. TaxID=1180 RepID=UPI002FF55631
MCQLTYSDFRLDTNGHCRVPTPCSLALYYDVHPERAAPSIYHTLSTLLLAIA